MILLVGTLLAGCAEPAAPAALVSPPPRLGDVVEYEVTGPYADLVRWEPELPPTLDRIRFTVEPGGSRLTPDLGRRDTFAVRLEGDGGSGWQTLDVRYVALASGVVVEVLTPFNETQSVLSWEEFGQPWAFGASVFMGKTNPPSGSEVPSIFPAPPHVSRVGDRWRASLPSHGATLTWKDGETWPETFRFEVLEEASAWLALGFERGTVFEGRKVAEKRGATELAIGTVVEEAAPVAALVAFDGRAPPERGDGLVFPLRDAMEAAETQDTGLRAWLDANPENRLARATYFLAAPSAPNGPPEPAWNLGYVTPEETYYEVKVARIAGLPLARTYDSGTVPAPKGQHGWIDGFPAELLALDDAVAAFQKAFSATGYEIFVRSFTGDARTAPGYYYLIDGGFEERMGRYTTTWNAQTGLLESAVGTVEPL